MAEVKRITIEGRFAFLSIFDRKDWGDDKEPKFEATLLMDNKDAELEKFVKNAAHEKFGKKLPAKLHSPVRPGDDCVNPDGEVYEGHEGKTVVKSSSLFDLKQIVVQDGDKFKNATDDEIKSGDYGKMILGAGGYDVGGNKGVSLYLVSICKTKDGEALGGGGGTSEEDVFGEVEADDEMFS